MASESATHSRLKSCFWAGGTFVLGIGLTCLFFAPLCSGGGIVGGDIYPYYFPQKAVLADALQHAELPFWNPFVGFGYPTLGESQTGVLYLPHLLLYRCFDLNTAYNLSQLLHYIGTFWVTWQLVRCWGVSGTSALFVATTFVFGWFPPRICLEWAIIGGFWMVVMYWGCTVFLQKRNWVALSGAACALGLSLLAGHYNIAFISLLFLPLLPFLLPPVAILSPTASPSERSPSEQPLLQRECVAGLLAMVVTGFLIGSVQILPSWELKSLSQREETHPAFQPTYGHLPPVALSQLWQPWSWYAGERSFDDLLTQSTFWAVPNATNQAEAALYVGLLTLLLVLGGLLAQRLRRPLARTRFWRWGALACLGALFATGWPTYFLSWLPGIGFFRGPGRYSLITALALSMMAGLVLDALFGRARETSIRRLATLGLLLVLTTVDLWGASRQFVLRIPTPRGSRWNPMIFYALLVEKSPIQYREESPLAKFLKEERQTVRLYGPGANIPTLLNVSALPVYLGLGPRIYESELVHLDDSLQDPEEIAAACSRLRELGVTHIIAERPFDHVAWEVELVHPFYDPLLNRALARPDNFYLYRLQHAFGRASVLDSPEAKVTVSGSTVRVTVTADFPEPVREAVIVLRDLNYPGWSPEPGAVPVELTTLGVENLFRAARVQSDQPTRSLQVTWVYRPRSVAVGAGLSSLGILLLVAIPWQVLRKRSRTAKQIGIQTDLSDSASSDL